MRTIILKWNPAFSSYTQLRFLKDLHYASERDAEDRKSNWSVWDYDKVSKGDRFYMLKVGFGQTGIVSRGIVTSDAYIDEDWSPNNRPRYYVDYVPDFMINPDGMKILSSEVLSEGIPDFDWRGGHSGIVLSDQNAAKLEEMWQTYLEEETEYFNKASDDNLFMQAEEEETACGYKMTFSRNYDDELRISIEFRTPYFEKTLYHNIKIFDFHRALKMFKVSSKRLLINTFHQLYPTPDSLGSLCADLYTFGINFNNSVNIITNDNDDDVDDDED